MPSELKGIPNPFDPRAFASAIRDIANLLGINRLRARVTAGSLSGGTRRWTIQVVNRRGDAVKVRAMMRVHIATSEGGAPPASGTQTASWVDTNQVRFTYRPNADWDIQTDADGQAQVDISDSGETLWLHAVVHADAQSGSGAY